MAGAANKKEQSAQAPEASKPNHIAFFGKWHNLSFAGFKFTFPARVIITRQKMLFIAIRNILPRYSSPVALSLKLYGPLRTEEDVLKLSPFSGLAQTGAEMQRESRKMDALEIVRDFTVDLDDFKKHFRKAINAIAAGNEKALRELCPDPGQTALPELEEIF